jgi:hypothetical protein
VRTLVHVVVQSIREEGRLRRRPHIGAEVLLAEQFVDRPGCDRRKKLALGIGPVTSPPAMWAPSRFPSPPSHRRPSRNSLLNHGKNIACTRYPSALPDRSVGRRSSICAYQARLVTPPPA